MITEKIAITLQELAIRLGRSERTIRRRLKGMKSGDVLFGSWKVIDTNPNGERRQWVFESLQQPNAVAA